jgi:hypothetical protein
MKIPRRLGYVCAAPTSQPAKMRQRAALATSFATSWLALFFHAASLTAGDTTIFSMDCFANVRMVQFGVAGKL